ncbi:RNA helicase [bacterium]|nr:RNA helicase [bacterium]|tara:strand:+ start:132 stop:1568 length:1437 start_codon:yes stop_codon:yes gene_type:complete
MAQQTFRELGLSDTLLQALDKKGFKEPTPIQAATIPAVLLDDKDIIGQAETGTGKTAAFGLPIIDKIDPNSKQIDVLVMSPTRELTLQVANELSLLKGEKNLVITPIYGGQSIEKQKQQLKRVNNIIIGTPGRLMDHLRGRKIDLSCVKYVVLDEADEMLNSGFIEDIEYILSKTNTQRRTLLFSATMPKPILTLAKTVMKEFVTIQTKKVDVDISRVSQTFYELKESDKLEALCRLIDVEDEFYGLIFCRTKRDVDMINEKMISRGYNTEAMHGDLSQFQRERVLQKFRKKICKMLVVTDVAARGLDINNLTHVINYALPQDPESYVHRSGRTGRAGKSGHVISLITPAEFRKLNFIQRITKINVKKGTLPDVEKIIQNRKIRIKKTIQKKIDEGIEPKFYEFANDILDEYSIEDTLAGILKAAFESDLSEKHYAKINLPQREGRKQFSKRGNNRFRGHNSNNTYQKYGNQKQRRKY